MKKIFTFIFIVGLLFTTNSVFAENLTNTTNQTETIKQLKEQIQLLQTQIVGLKTEVQSVKKELEFSRVLASGAKGEDVKQLQEFLRNFTGVYPDGSIDGRFGPVTATAVKKFQKQNNLAPEGIVGPKTQNKLKMLASAIPTISATQTTSIQPSGQTTTTPRELTPSVISPTKIEISAVSVPVAIGPLPPTTICKTPTKAEIQTTFIKVVSPNGGEQWKIGGTYTIKYSVKNIAENKALLIYLEKGYDAPSTKIGANSSQLIGITTNLESYTYTVPSNISGWPGLGNNYKITIMVEGSYSSCSSISYIGDSSDETFSIVAGQANTITVTPAISGATTTFGDYTNSAIGTTSGGGYGKENKITSLLNEINALQNQLNNIIDDEKRAFLMTQVTELKAQVKMLQSVSDTTTSVVPVMMMSVEGLGQHFNDQTSEISVSAQTNAQKISVILKQISNLHYKLDYTTDVTTRTLLTTQIDELEKQEQAIRNKIDVISKQISILQTQLNNTTDTATRNFLTTQITKLKMQME